MILVVRLCVLTAALALFTGCATPKTISYQPKEPLYVHYPWSIETCPVHGNGLSYAIDYGFVLNGPCIRSEYKFCPKCIVQVP
jgi:hypothetical protein